MNHLGAVIGLDGAAGGDGEGCLLPARGRGNEDKDYRVRHTLLMHTTKWPTRESQEG